MIVPLLIPEISQTPNLNNKRCKNILAHHIKTKFMTESLLQNARTITKLAVFGYPEHNVQYADALCSELKTQGHDCVMIQHDALHVRRMLEEDILQEEVLKQKKIGHMMTAKLKQQFMLTWRKANASMLDEGGLGLIPDGQPSQLFFSGIYFSPNYTKLALPYLQQVFQADACHTSFGKYTMYTCYGTTANCNTFVIAVMILFGNETKVGWNIFFENVKKDHVTVNIPQRTFITDQAKGLTESIAEVMDEVGQICCYFHRCQNILKVVRGGSGKFSGVWLYKKCMLATNTDQLEKIKIDCANDMSTQALKYINALEDPHQFPCSRVGTSSDVYLYNRMSSQSAESMNRVNKPARDRTAVDPINSCMLLVELSNNQFERNREKAWKCESELTPHGEKLRKDIFEKVNYTDYYISVDTGDGDRVSMKVSRTGYAERICYFLVTEDELGSCFGGCSCGGPNVSGMPCHHMIAVVKSGRVAGLNSTNAMPGWWTTKMWRNQYPKEVKLSSITMNTLTSNYHANKSMRYIPPYAAPRKTGRPKSDKRSKSPLEGKPKKKTKLGTQQQMELESKKLSKRSRAGKMSRAGK